MAAVFFESSLQASLSAPLPYVPTRSRDSNAHEKGRRGKRYQWGFRDSQVNRDSTGRPGSKRFQRYLNRSFLLDQSNDVEFDDFSILMNTKTVFTDLHQNSETLSKWEEFIEVTEEKQEQLLIGLSIDVSKFVQQKITHRREFIQNMSPEASFNAIDKKLRRVLHNYGNSQMLADLDSELVQYITTGEFGSLVFTFSESYQRMLCHGICQFYSLNSQSQDMASGKRIVIVSKTQETRVPAITLTQHLQARTAL